MMIVNVAIDGLIRLFGEDVRFSVALIFWTAAVGAIAPAMMPWPTWNAPIALAGYIIILNANIALTVHRLAKRNNSSG